MSIQSLVLVKRKSFYKGILPGRLVIEWGATLYMYPDLSVTYTNQPLVVVL